MGTDPMQAEVQAQARRIALDRVERARERHPLEKLFASVELFELALVLAGAGVRHQHPDADERTFRQHVGQRAGQRMTPHPSPDDVTHDQP